MNVAMLPSRYAMLHLRMPRPVFDLAKVHDSLILLLDRLETFALYESFAVDRTALSWSSGDRSFA